MNTYSQKQHNKKQKTLQGEKKDVLLFMNNVDIIMYNASRSYLNGLVITINFFQVKFMYCVQNSYVK